MIPAPSAVANASTISPRRSRWLAIAAAAPSMPNKNVPTRSMASSNLPESIFIYKAVFSKRLDSFLYFYTASTANRNFAVSPELGIMRCIVATREARDSETALRVRHQPSNP